MLAPVREAPMLGLRGLLALAWLALIGSLFIHARPEGSGETSLFWNLIWLVPAVLLIAGHETWRRICPLSFFSQLPRYLRIQRHRGGVPALLSAQSFWVRHHYAVQFFLLSLGISLRLLLINYNEYWLACFLLALIAASLLIGTLWGGKSWCQYFCPIAPVQRFYSSPAGLFENPAHWNKAPVSQSMCRTVGDKPACVGCKLNCPDIDLEQAHWADLAKPERRWVGFGYPGLVVGFFLVLRLLGGQTTWTPQAQLPELLWENGPWGLQKGAFVPFCLGLCVLAGLCVGRLLEAIYRIWLSSRRSSNSLEIAQHRCAVVATYLTFNLFYLLAPGPLADWPEPLARLFGFVLVACSTIWLWRSLERSSYLYARERLAQSLREQLSKSEVALPDGRSLQSLNVDEVYVLAHALPNFSDARRLFAYKSMLREASSVAGRDQSQYQQILAEVRRSLDVSQEEHERILSDLEIEEQLRAEELQDHEPGDLLRLSRYEHAAAAYVAQRLREGLSVAQLAEPDNLRQLKEIALAHNLSEDERSHLVTRLLEKERKLENEARTWCTALEKLGRVQQELLAFSDDPLARWLARSLGQLKMVRAQSLLLVLHELGESPETLALARSANQWASAELTALLPNGLQQNERRSAWEELLPASVLAALLNVARPAEPPTRRGIEAVWGDYPIVLDPMGGALAARRLAVHDRSAALGLAQQLLALKDAPPFVASTAQAIIQEDGNDTAQRVEYLLQYPFFAQLSTTVLVELAQKAHFTFHAKGDVLVRKGTYTGDFLALAQGEARLKKNRHRYRSGETLEDVDSIRKGKFDSHLVASQDALLVTVPRLELDTLLGRQGSSQWLSTQRDLLGRLSLAESADPVLAAGLKLELTAFENQVDHAYVAHLEELTASCLVLSLEDTPGDALSAGRMLNASFRTPDASRYGFVTYVRAERPNGRYELERPASFYPYQPRRKVRVECEFSGQMRWRESDNVKEATFVTKDLGMGGASILFYAELAIAVGDLAVLEIEAPGHGTLELEARILRQQELRLPNDVIQQLICVSFESVPDAIQRSLYRLVFNALRKNVESTKILGDTSWLGYRPFQISDIQAESVDVSSFYLRPVDELPLAPYRPGQFLTFKLMIRDKSDNLLPVVRCYSLSDACNPNSYRVSVKRLPNEGLASNFLHAKARVGDIVHVAAPQGDFVLDASKDTPLALVAAGIGITPLLAMLKELDRQNSRREVWLFLGVTNAERQPFREKLLQVMESRPHWHYRVSYSAPAAGDELGKAYHRRGRVEGDWICELAPPARDFDYYLCGPSQMMSDCVASLLAGGTAVEKIHYEAFGPNKVARMLAAARGEAAPTQQHQVRFASSDLSCSWSPADGSLLEFAESQGVRIPFGCRVGNCHRCALTLVSGEVTYERTPPVDPGPKFCLVCIGRPASDLVLDI